MNTDLFLAILSMDAYNRPGTQNSATTVVLQLPPAAQNAIGNAFLDSPTAQSDIPGDSFFAQVYEWLGSTVISFRGTDDKSLTADPLTGWVTGIGAYGTQAHDAAYLYQQLNGNSPTPNNNFLLTGDSLGGGLAGFIGEIYNDDATVFDNMPFELTASSLYDNATQPPLRPTDLPARQFFYADNPIVTSEDKIHGYAINGEILQILRRQQVAPITTLDPGQVYPSQSAYQLHDIATLIILLDARLNNDTSWTPVQGFVVGASYDNAIANAIGEAPAGVKGTGDPFYKMQMMIAYSAIDGGTYVYGDTGIVSLFQDADAFGTMERANNLAAYLQSKPVESAIAGIITEYAGLLAINQDTNAKDESVFTYLPGTNRMVIDFSHSRWVESSGGQGSFDGKQVQVVGKISLTDAAVMYAGGRPSSIQDAVATLWGGKTDNIIKLVAATTDQDGVTLDATADAGITGQDTDTTKATDGAMLVAGGGKGDQLTGSVGNNLLVGGSGGDTFTAGTGVDLMFGGSGKDTFILGQGGTNWVDGGTGFDTAQYNTSDPLLETIASNYTTNGDPIITVVDNKLTTKSTGMPATDSFVAVEDVKLGGGANTVKVTALPFFQSNVVTDLGAISTSSGDVVDFSQYPGSVYLGSAHPAQGAPNAVEVYRNKNFSQDAGFGFTNFNTLILGDSGSNNLDLHTADDPYLTLVQAGNGNNQITSDIVNLTINLGTGTNLVKHVAKGTIVNEAKGGKDSVVASDDELITGSNPSDNIFNIGDILLRGAVGVVGSEDPWIVGPDQTKYGLNYLGQLVIQNTDGQTAFVSGYQGGPNVPYSQQTDGIFVGLEQVYAERLLDLKRPYNDNIHVMFKLGNEILYTKTGQTFFNSDPLVFDLNGSGINLTTMTDASPMLDMQGTGFAVHTGWVEPNDGVLVLEQNGGDGTPNIIQMLGGPGTEGFAALAQYDSNADGIIDASDPVYAQLRMWVDLNGEVQRHDACPPQRSRV